jgi:hypothetical protein
MRAGTKVSQQWHCDTILYYTSALLLIAVARNVALFLGGAASNQLLEDWRSRDNGLQWS